ncbi:MAG: hypothetical protein AAB332_01555 [Planctomycetota bacterium]
MPVSEAPASLFLKISFSDSKQSFYCNPVPKLELGKVGNILQGGNEVEGLHEQFIVDKSGKKRPLFYP